METRTYRQQLIERQAAEGWSDREMARQLGIGSGTWTRIRRGTRGLGGQVVLRSLARFPEYREQALSFLPTSASERSDQGDYQEQEALRAGD